MDSDDDDRQQYNKLYQQQIAVTRLLDAIKGDHRALLNNRLEDCRKTRVKRDNHTYKKGRMMYRLIESLEKDLDSALRSDESYQIEDAIQNIKASEVARFLKENIAEAERSLNGSRFPKIPTHTIGLGKAAMSEMRTYFNPSPLVKNVMTATLLLLDEDEEKTERWSYVVSRTFPTSLNRRMVEFDVERLDDRIKERAKYLLRHASLAKIRKACPGAAPFYVWTRDIVGGDSDTEEDPDEQLARLERELRGKMNENLRSKHNEPRVSQVELDRINKDIEDVKRAREREREIEEKKRAAAIRFEKELFAEREREEKLRKAINEPKGPAVRNRRNNRESVREIRGVNSNNSNNTDQYRYSPGRKSYRE